MEKTSCWFYGSGQAEKLQSSVVVRRRPSGEAVEYGFVIGKAAGELCSKSSGLQLRSNSFVIKIILIIFK